MKTSVKKSYITGLHGPYSANSHATYAYAGYLSPGLSKQGHEDITSMSHEIGEWMNDPFVDNVVPGSTTPGRANTCYTFLEVGDPTDSFRHGTFEVKVGKVTYHPEDLAGLSWFAHQSPSTEKNGLYSYNGTLKTPATRCKP